MATWTAVQPLRSIVPPIHPKVPVMRTVVSLPDTFTVEQRPVWISEALLVGGLLEVMGPGPIGPGWMGSGWWLVAFDPVGLGRGRPRSGPARVVGVGHSRKAKRRKRTAPASAHTTRER